MGMIGSCDMSPVTAAYCAHSQHVCSGAEGSWMTITSDSTLRPTTWALSPIWRIPRMAYCVVGPARQLVALVTLTLGPPGASGMVGVAVIVGVRVIVGIYVAVGPIVFVGIWVAAGKGCILAPNAAPAPSNNRLPIIPRAIKLAIKGRLANPCLRKEKNVKGAS